MALTKVEKLRGLYLDDHADTRIVFLCSQPEECSRRLDTYANASPTLVLIESNARSTHDGSVLDKRKNALPLLQRLGADVEGARFQKPVLPFILLNSEDTVDVSDASERSFTAQCLSAGAVDIIRSPLQHDDINHLVGHLKEKVRPPARLIASQMAQNLIDSIHDLAEPKPACHRPDLLLSSERKQVVEKAVRRWRFPASDLNMDELTYAVMIMVEHLLQAPQLEAYALPREQLIGFLLATRRQYKHEREVHYHNWRHAVDVTQSIYCFLMDVQLCPPSDGDDRPQKELNAMERMITHLDGLILLISAIGHDVGHPGVNNAFLVAVNHPLAQTYNDKSVLENYHCAAYSQLLRRHWPALHGIPSFRAIMISTILATDMQRHFDYMKSLRELKSQLNAADAKPDEWNDKDKEHTRELVMALLMKAADISNVARPFDVSAKWAKILMNEFARQGELEAELDIPTCLFGGPPDKEDTLAAAQSQKGFMSLFGHPLFQGISDIMPAVSCSVRELEKNQEIWDQKIEEEKGRRKPTGSEGHLTLSSVTQQEVDRATSHGRKSEPRAVPAYVPQSPTSETSRVPDNNHEVSPSKHAAHELRQQLAQGFSNEHDRTSSMPFLGSTGAALSHTASSPSRRSSKDVALDQLQQLSAFAHQSLSPTPSSRRASADWQVQQSYPSSRRGSKDESLTTILVTSGGTPNRRSSPASPAKTAASSPGKHSTKRQSQKQTPVRNSVSSPRSHAASTGTATTAQQSVSTQPSSTQPSSSSEEDTKPTQRPSMPPTEDPFMVPGTWTNNYDGTHRSLPPQGSRDDVPSNPPPLPLETAKSGDSRVSATTPTEESRSTWRKDGRVRESRSRSRLRGLKFWKKKKEATTGSSAEGTPTAESPSSP